MDRKETIVAIRKIVALGFCLKMSFSFLVAFLHDWNWEGFETIL